MADVQNIHCHERWSRWKPYSEGAKFTAKTPDEFGTFVKAEIAKWAKVVKTAGIRVD